MKQYVTKTLIRVIDWHDREGLDRQYPAWHSATRARAQSHDRGAHAPSPAANHWTGSQAPRGPSRTARVGRRRGSDLSVTTTKALEPDDRPRPIRPGGHQAADPQVRAAVRGAQSRNRRRPILLHRGGADPTGVVVVDGRQVWKRRWRQSASSRAGRHQVTMCSR